MLMLVNALRWVKSWSIQADDGSAKAFQGRRDEAQGWLDAGTCSRCCSAPQQHQPQGKGLSTCSL